MLRNGFPLEPTPFYETVFRRNFDTKPTLVKFMLLFMTLYVGMALECHKSNTSVHYRTGLPDGFFKPIIPIWVNFGGTCNGRC
jgi:hypothetical protein